MNEVKKQYYHSLIVLLLGIVFIIYVFISFKHLDYEWNFTFLIEYFRITKNSDNTYSIGFIWQGLWGTLWISLVSISLGTIMGFLCGGIKLLNEPISKILIGIYVEIFRNTPVLVQLYVIYFVIGTTLNLSAITSGLITLSLFCGAYITEIFRSTISNFDKGQIDAAKSMGFNFLQTAIYIVAPQALKKMLPTLIGQFVSLVKDSSLVSVISIVELTKSAQNIISNSFKSFETWFMIATLYFIINISISSLGKYLEYRLSEKNVK